MHIYGSGDIHKAVQITLAGCFSCNLLHDVTLIADRADTVYVSLRGDGTCAVALRAMRRESKSTQQSLNIYEIFGKNIHFIKKCGILSV